jgi:hypothetical protein
MLLRRTASSAIWTTSFLTALVVSLLLAGCGDSGPEMAPVSGIVTVDGQPVANAAVMFVPEAGGRPATGLTDAEGKFSLETLKPGDGALVGKHKVTVTGVKTTGVQATEDGLSGSVDPGQVREEWFVPQKYSKPDTSGLTQEVTQGMPPVELKLSK